MKKLLLKSLFLLCALIVGSNAWATEKTLVYSVTSKTAVTLQNTSTGSFSGTVTFANNDANNNDQLTSGKTMTLTLSNFPYKVTKVSLNLRRNSSKGGGTVAITHNGENIGGGTKAKGDLTSSYTNYDFSCTDDETEGNLIVLLTSSENSFWCNLFTITYDDPNSGSSTPSITANDVNIAYDATNGSIGYSVANGNGNVTAEVTSGNWLALGTITASEVPFTCSANTGAERTATVTLSYTGATNKVVTVTQNAIAVDAPTFNIGTGTYTSAQSVTLNCATDGATIHYTMTTDGTTPNAPTESDATYSSAISVTKNGTKIKATAFKSGVASTVASATYTIKPNKPTITAAGATVTITADDGCDIYYTIDNSDPSKSSTHYTGPFNLDDDCPIKAVAYDAYDNASDYRVINYVYLPLEPKNINSNHYVKVTDVNTLENGDAVLIVCESHNVAMSTTQNTNNRGQDEVSISNNTIDNPAATVQKLVLMKKDGYFYFHTGSGYLYAASGSSNYLRTETRPDDDDNAKATITISNGDATILFQGKNSVNWVKHNNSNSIFSCYPSNNTTMDIVQIYKEVPVEPTDPVASGNTVTLTTTTNMNGWRTFAPVKADQNYTTDADVYYVSTTGSSSVTLVKIEGGVPANTPVILHKTDGTTITLTETDDAITAPGASNLLAVSTADQNLGKVYRLGYKSAYGVGFYTYTTTSAPEGIVYINPSSSAHEFLGLDFDGETTGVADITNTNLTNNTNEFYNLAGQRVAQPTKGLYIVNGKKVILH